MGAGPGRQPADRHGGASRQHRLRRQRRHQDRRRPRVRRPEAAAGAAADAQRRGRRRDRAARRRRHRSRCSTTTRCPAGYPSSSTRRRSRSSPGKGQAFSSGSVVRYIPDVAPITTDDVVTLEYATYPEGSPDRAVDRSDHRDRQAPADADDPEPATDRPQLLGQRDRRRHHHHHRADQRHRPRRRPHLRRRHRRAGRRLRRPLARPGHLVRRDDGQVRGIPAQCRHRGDPLRRPRPVRRHQRGVHPRRRGPAGRPAAPDRRPRRHRRGAGTIGERRRPRQRPHLARRRGDLHRPQRVQRTRGARAVHQARRQHLQGDRAGGGAGQGPRVCHHGRPVRPLPGDADRPRPEGVQQPADRARRHGRAQAGGDVHDGRRARQRPRRRR